MPGPPLTIVIVSYQCRELLRDCLESVRAHHGLSTPPTVWVVDNGSTDGTLEMVRERFPEVLLRSTEANTGFSAANNIALRETVGEDVLILNPDTVLHKGTLPRLLEILEARPEVGMIGCRLVRRDGTLDHASRRSFPTITGALGHFTRVGRGGRAPAALAQYRAPEKGDGGPVDAINGAFMLIRGKALADVGLFDEGYWLYMEDLDLCYRFKQSGWIVWYEPSVTTTHVKAGTSGSHRRARQNYAFHYGMVRFYRKFYASERPWPVNVAVYAGVAAKLVVSMGRSFVARGMRSRPAIAV